MAVEPKSYILGILIGTTFGIVVTISAVTGLLSGQIDQWNANADVCESFNGVAIMLYDFRNMFELDQVTLDCLLWDSVVEPQKDESQGTLI